MNTLEHLIEMGIPAVCNKWMTLPSNPDIVDIDLLYQAAGGGGHRYNQLYSSKSSFSSMEKKRGTLINLSYFHQPIKAAVHT